MPIAQESQDRAQPAQRTVVDVLQSLAAELDRTAEGGDSLESLMADLAPYLPSERAMEEMQAIDALVQRLRCLAGFTRGLAEAVSPTVTADCRPALSTVTLGELYHRLNQSAPDIGPGAAGDLDLF